MRAWNNVQVSIKLSISYNICLFSTRLPKYCGVELGIGHTDPIHLLQAIIKLFLLHSEREKDLRRKKALRARALQQIVTVVLVSPADTAPGEEKFSHWSYVEPL